ncbi:MAG: glycoside hydrolase family 38 C-terminal domain-containing protein, partial [Planctomycetota bacterium]
RRLKQLNVAAEESLREAEMFACIAPAKTRVSLDDQWRTLLTNQFHDILPGSSIREVNQQAERELGEVCECAAKVIASHVRAPTNGQAPGSGVWNPASTTASAVVERPGGLVFVRDVQPAAVSPINAAEPERPVEATPTSLRNGVVAVELNAVGEIASLRGPNSTEVVTAPMHQYRLFRDRPHMWDAWEIDPDYDRDEIALRAETEVQLVQSDPMRCAIEARRALTSSSSVTTRYVLDAESLVLRVELEIDWNESHRLLRVEYPTTVASPVAVAGTQFGSIERPTDRNTSWDAAQFEFPAHRFVSLGRPGAGLAVFAADIHGWSCSGSTIGASLLRSPAHPDPEADRGVHRFVIGLYPHSGDWRREGVSAAAERFARPVRLVDQIRQVSSLRWGVDGNARLELSALMPDANDAACIIARFVEVDGGSGSLRLFDSDRIETVTRTDALGRRSLATYRSDDDVPIGPGQIVTLRIERGR